MKTKLYIMQTIMEKNDLLKQIKKGFSLTEILISLVIVGVIAVMTAPALFHDVRENTWKKSYRKAYSTAQQAWLIAYNKKKIATLNDWWDEASHTANFNTFKSQFNVIKECVDNASECWVAGDTYYNSLPLQDDSIIFIDSSGMAWAKACVTGCAGEILVDTNGHNGPNKFGRDRFIFHPCGEGASYPCKPMKLIANDDIIETHDRCHYGNCYYSSWLIK
ncbi:MAG: hypothetical protein A2287_01220 [Candidatus Melainabacteria bacterium RIFOXYA12_FULL_32_12]|nr:MAG: hypothetical protein A2287_01220 [Candidatus Melainabacteria bacterium RIFOXYA12_FULL_32_12]